ncbi:MAG: PleD family two-component system response regulator [Porcipelethomonas sp.]
MRKTILVVDDDMMNLRMAEFILSKENYNVIQANSGMTCLNILRDDSYPKVDLIMLDIQMPIIDGFKTLEIIKEDDSINDIPVMFLTASSDGYDVKKAVGMGVVSYVKKPFLPQDLLKRVSEIIGEA